MVSGRAGKGGVLAASRVGQDKDPGAERAPTPIHHAREPAVEAAHKTMKCATPNAVS